MGEVSAESSEPLGDPGSWLSQNVAVVCHIARRVADHQGLRQNAYAALATTLLARLVEEDHRVLRHYRGTADLTTYLAVVATRLLLEQRAAASPSPPPSSYWSRTRR
jgi:hypothetical protein